MQLAISTTHFVKHLTKSEKIAIRNFVDLSRDKDFGTVHPTELLDPNKPSRVGSRMLDKLSLLGIITKHGSGESGICYEILNRQALDDIISKIG